MSIELTPTAKSLVPASLTSVAPSSPEEVAVTKKVSKDHLINGLQLYCLGVATVLGHQVFGWNQGLDRGFWEYFMTVGVLGVGYLCLSICLAGMTSSLTLPGGVFSYVRCVCGPFSGFLVGVGSTIEYIFYITAAVSLLGDALSVVINFGGFLRPLYFLGFYVLTIYIQNGVGARLSVFVYVLLGLLTLIVILCYCLQTADTAKLDNTSLPKGFDSPTHFMYAMHFGGWFYVGQDSLPLMKSRVAEPQRTLPRVLIALSVTTLCTALAILLMTVSIPPSSSVTTTSTTSSSQDAQRDYYTENLPLVFGFLERWHFSYQKSMYIMCLGLFSTAYGFVFFLTRHLQTLASAGILPSPLAKVSSYTNTPVFASISGCFVSYILLLFVYYNVQDFITSVFRVVYIAACMKYVFIFRAYIIMQSKPLYVHTVQTVSNTSSTNTAAPTSTEAKAGLVTSCFRSLPRFSLGIAIALLGSLIFSVTFASLVYYQTNDNWSAIVFGACLALCVLYYSLHGRHEEFFSDEERDMVMKKFIYNAKRRKNPKHFFSRYFKRHLLRLRAPFEPILPNPQMHNDVNDTTEIEESKNNGKAAAAAAKKNEGAERMLGTEADRLETGGQAVGSSALLPSSPGSPLSPQIREQFMNEMFDHMQSRYNDIVRTGGVATPYPTTPYPSTPYTGHPYPGTPYPTHNQSTPYQPQQVPYSTAYPQMAQQHPFAHIQPSPAAINASALQALPKSRVSFIAPELDAQNKKAIEDLFSPRPIAAPTTSARESATPAIITSPSAVLPTVTPTPVTALTPPVSIPTPIPTPAPAPTPRAPLFDLPAATGPRLPAAQSLQPMGVPFGQFAWSGVN